MPLLKYWNAYTIHIDNKLCSFGDMQDVHWPLSGVLLYLLPCLGRRFRQRDTEECLAYSATDRISDRSRFRIRNVRSYATQHRMEMGLLHLSYPLDAEYDLTDLCPLQVL